MQPSNTIQFFNQGLTLQDVLTSQYSILYQERMYLLNALAEEESQGEHFTHSLSVLQAQLHEKEGANPPLSTKKLKQQIKAVRNKIGACQHRERAIATNLANVVAQMEGLKRYQSRSVQQDYAMQLQQAQQHAQLVLMSPARPNFALRSPGTMDLASQMQFMSLGQPMNASLAQQPLDPYSAAHGQSMPMFQIGSPFGDYSQAHHWYTEASPVLRNLEAYGGVTEADIEFDRPISPLTVISPTTSHSIQDRSHGSVSGGRQRATSLLTPANPDGTSEPNPLPSKPINDGAVRRLSLLDGTSAAMQLERKAAEAGARMQAGGT